MAVATAFCAIDSTAVTLPTEWPFGVNDTGITYVLDGVSKILHDFPFSSHFCQVALTTSFIMQFVSGINGDIYFHSIF